MTICLGITSAINCYGCYSPAEYRWPRCRDPFQGDEAYDHENYGVEILRCPGEICRVNNQKIKYFNKRWGNLINSITLWNDLTDNYALRML